MLAIMHINVEVYSIIINLYVLLASPHRLICRRKEKFSFCTIENTPPLC